jgi:hypothetical protein
MSYTLSVAGRTAQLCGDEVKSKFALVAVEKICRVRVLSVSAVIVAILLFAHSACCSDTDSNRIDEASLRGYMTGEYDLIGRKGDSTATYTGHVTFRDDGKILQVTRTVKGKTDTCSA